MYNTEFKKYIKSKAKTQKEFADKVGVGEDYISSIVQGHNEITEPLYDKIKNAFGDIPEILFKKSTLNTGDNSTITNNSQVNEPPEKYVTGAIAVFSKQLEVKDSQISNKDAQIFELLSQQKDLIKILTEKLNHN